MFFHGRQTSSLQKCMGQPLSLKSSWKCSAHPLKNVTMLFGVLLTPKFFFVERDDSYMELLLNYLYKFWNLACDEIQPPWHKNVFGLKQKSKKIATKSPCLIPNSLITPNVLSHSDLKNFDTIDKPAKML